MTNAGELLRELRQACDKTMEEIEAETGVSCRALSNLELGVTTKPTRKTLDALLPAYRRGAPVGMEICCGIYTAYRYHPPFPLPEAGEIDEARRWWRAECGNAPLPAYLIDASQRLLAWNPAALRLGGLHPRDRRIQYFERATTIDLAFGLVERFVTIENLEAYRYSFVGTLKRELRPYKAEDWYIPCIAAAQRRYPDFKRLWAMEHPPPDSPIGCPIPLRLYLPGQNEALTFSRVKIPFLGDPRFQTVQWQPADLTTGQAWAALHLARP